jgi:hypothetical protein
MSRIEEAGIERPRPDAAAAAVPDAEAYKGLCEACAIAPQCTFPRDPVKKVVHCEEFVGIVKPDIRLAPPAARAWPRPAPAPPRAGLRGLCADCALRETCTYPKPESGVWRCEEYA